MRRRNVMLLAWVAAGVALACPTGRAQDVRLQHTLRGHEHTVTSVAFSPDGKALASGSGNNRIKLWDVAAGRDVATVVHTGQAYTGVRPVRGLAFSPDGTVLSSAPRFPTVTRIPVDLLGLCCPRPSSFVGLPRGTRSFTPP